MESHYNPIGLSCLFQHDANQKQENVSKRRQIAKLQHTNYILMAITKTKEKNFRKHWSDQKSSVCYSFKIFEKNTKISGREIPKKYTNCSKRNRKKL